MEVNSVELKVKALEEKTGKKVLSIEEVADYLGLDISMVQSLVEGGELKAMQSKEQLFFKTIHVANFECDIKENNSISQSKGACEKVKVTKGSFYKVNSKKNPIEMAFKIVFDDGTVERVKARGKSEEDIINNVKPRKILEKVEAYRNGLKSYSIDNTVDVVEIEEKRRTFKMVSDEWYEKFLYEQKSRGNSYANIDSAKYSLKAVCKVIGDMDITSIDKDVAQDMINSISVDEKTGEMKSASHVKKALMKFDKVMQYARKCGYTHVEIEDLILNKNLREPDKNSRFLGIECVGALLETVKNHDFYNTLIHTILSSGVRQEEALALNIDDVREKAGTYRVYVSKANVEIEKNKYAIIEMLKQNEEPREIVITKDTYDMIINYYNSCLVDERLMENRKKYGTERMIFTDRDGKVRNKRTLYHSFVGYLERNFKPEDKVRLHMLRHTFATLMSDEISLSEVSTILGHRSEHITKKFYKSTTEKEHMRASAGVEKMMGRIKRE